MTSHSKLTFVRFTSFLTASLWLAGLSGCVSPGAGSAGAPLTVEQLDARLREGPARIEVRFTADASAVDEIQVSTEVGHDEHVESVVTAADAAAGTITLQLAGLVVDVALSARLRNDEGDLGRTAFFAEIDGALAAGNAVFVRAKRPPRRTPSVASDPTFVATEVRIEDEPDLPEVELAVDDDNLILTGSSASLRLLGHPWPIDGAFIRALAGGSPSGDDTPGTDDSPDL